MTQPKPALRENRQIRCLVIQLSLLDDTLQSLMALRAAKELYPGLEIHFLAREKFAVAAQKVPWLAAVHTFSSQNILGPILSGRKTRREGVGDIARWVSPFTENIWDLVLNWSYSEASSYLTALIPGRVKLGFSRRADLTLSCLDGWSQYVQGVIQGGVTQNIHITDLLTTQLLTALQIHYGEPVNAQGAVVTSRKFFKLELQDDEKAWRKSQATRKWLGIHIGTNRTSHSLSMSFWAQVIKKILLRHSDVNIVILGKKETLRQQEVLFSELGSTHESPNLLSLVGKTNFDFWSCAIADCQWVFSESCAAVQLASLLGTRVVHLSLGPNRWLETGPYGNGHYVVSPAEECYRCKNSNSPLEHGCKNQLTPEAVYATWSYGCSEWAHRRQVTFENHLRQLGYSDNAKNVKVFRSKIRNIHEGGGVVYEPVNHYPLNFEEWTSMVAGHTARAWYCGWVPDVGQELSRGAINTLLMQQIRALEEPLNLLKNHCESATHILTQLNQLGKGLKSEKVMTIQERDQLRSLGLQLELIDKKIDEIGKQNVFLKAFSSMCKVLMHNIPGSQISELGREGIECYRQLSEGVKIIFDWINHTLNLMRPIAVKSDESATIKNLSIKPEKDITP